MCDIPLNDMINDKKFIKKVMLRSCVSICGPVE